MKMTKQRKVYASMLAIAAVALLMDRAFLGDGSSAPGPAAAAPANPPATLAPADTPGDRGAEEARRLLRRVANGTGASEATETLAHRLGELAADRALAPDRGPDAFTPDPAWVPPTAPEPEPAPGQNTEPPDARPDAVEQFLANHQLRAVLATGEGGLAILAGESDPIRVGDTLDGFTLKAVTARAAIFEAGDRRAVLGLDSP